MRAKTTADILWLVQLVLYYSNGMNLLKGRGTSISAVHSNASLRCSTRCCARDSDSMYFNCGVHTYSAALVNTPEAFYQRSAVTRSVCVNGPLQSAEWKRCST